MNLEDQLPAGHEPEDRTIEQKNSLGEKASIRFFDPNNTEDILRLKEIIGGESTQTWMDEVSDLNEDDLKYWAREKGKWRKKNAFLFAVTPNSEQTNAGEAMGFVYIYGGHEERSQANRLIKKGFLPLKASKGKIFEISAAAMPNPEGLQENSGLMASAIRQALIEVDRIGYKNKIRDIINRVMGLADSDFQKLIGDIQANENNRVEPNTYVYAFIDPKNTNSLRAFEAAGFVDVGEATYDPDDETDPAATRDRVLVLDWSKMQKRLAEKSYTKVFKDRDILPKYSQEKPRNEIKIIAKLLDI